MFDVFRTSSNLEIVSIHIPKTAGTSFRNTLKTAYGMNNVVRLDINLQQKQIRLNEMPYTKTQLPRKVKVVHGHFCPKDLQNHFTVGPEVSYITWLRHPVDRVISNYYYLAKRLKEELDEKSKGLNILSKMQRSLMEYARAEKNCNRISKFLDGIALKEMAFVGIQEHYESDLKELAKHFDWPDFQLFEHNITGSKYEVSDVERKELEALNQLDMAIYEEGLSLRKERVDQITI